jgi:RNA polymerase sigma factor (sigma-70 family)
MPVDRMSEVIQLLRRAVLRDADGLTDEQLLESFFRQHDETALAVVIRRHGPMVWAVCRHLLRNYQDAEDAFQATFCVLVQKGASIRNKALTGNWLHGVAHQIAVRIRAATARRAGREKQMLELPELAAAEEDRWNDWRPLLHQEVSRLPDRYRVLIILCDLEGKTRKEAARQLDIPEGTVAGRLARARTMLAKRLGRRGLRFSGGALGTLLAAQTGSACLPPVVLSATIRAATGLAASSPRVVALTQEVIKVMGAMKVKFTTIALLAVLLGGMGVMAVAQACGFRRGTAYAPRMQPIIVAETEAPREKAGTAVPIFGEHLNVIARQMNVIKDRLNNASGGKQTQKLQKEVLDHIDELVKGLDRIEDKTQIVKDLLAEMKLIAAMQKRVNTRTELQSSQYQGEQVPAVELAKTPQEREQFEALRLELKQLAARQEQLAKLTKDLASKH